MPLILKAIAVLLRWGPTALTLFEQISKLIHRMTDDEEKRLVTKDLAAIMAFDSVQPKWRIEQLEDLKCRAEGCKLR